jgi:hypothetical protein
MQVLTPSIFTLLSSAFCLLVFWLLYELWLHRESFLQANRWFLLLAPVFALLIPHFQLSLELSEKSSLALQRVSEWQSLPPELWYMLFPQKAPLFALSIGQIIWSLYLSGLVFFLLRSAWQYAQVYRLLNKGTALKSGQDWTWVENPQATEIASFFHYILVPQKDKVPDLVLEHELVHMRQGHSWDLLFMEILCALLWFHPLVHCMRKRLRETHEYLADQGVVQGQVQGLYQYARLMVSHSSPQKDQQMIYHPFAAQVNQRLRRLAQPHSKQFQAFKYAVCLPLVTCMGLFFSVQFLQALPLSEGKLTLKDLSTKFEHSKVLKTISTEKIQPKELQFFERWGAIDTIPTKVNVTVNSTSSKEETTTITIGGPEKTISITPKTSDKEHPLYLLDGVQITHEKMSSIDPETIATIDVLKGDGAIKEYGEAGKNGVVKIQSKGKEGSNSQSSSKSVTLNVGSDGIVKTKTETIEINASGQNLSFNNNSQPMSGKPLVIIDGVNKGRMNYGQSGAPISDLNPGDIKKIEIVKGDKAIKQYGKDAEEGVIIITTKNKKE